MAITVSEIDAASYAQYAEIDSSYLVRTMLKVVPKDGGLGGFKFEEEVVSEPYRKRVDDPAASPASWPPANETGTFAAFLAMDENVPVGGAAVVTNPSGAFALERRDSLTGLFDIRVRPGHRRSGLGTRLFLHVAEWAKGQGCNQLRVECQNVNVDACRFYARHCELGGVERYGYASCPDVAQEAMLLWYRNL